VTGKTHGITDLRVEIQTRSVRSVTPNAFLLSVGERRRITRHFRAVTILLTVCLTCNKHRSCITGRCSSSILSETQETAYVVGRRCGWLRRYWCDVICAVWKCVPGTGAGTSAALSLGFECAATCRRQQCCRACHLPTLGPRATCGWRRRFTANFELLFEDQFVSLCCHNYVFLSDLSSYVTKQTNFVLETSDRPVYS
jgi:hypothetical protein